MFKTSKSLNASNPVKSKIPKPVPTNCVTTSKSEVNALPSSIPSESYPKAINRFSKLMSGICV